VYWSRFSWVGALHDGTGYSPAYSGDIHVFTGQHEFVDTVILLKVDHEAAPKALAFGMGGNRGRFFSGSGTGRPSPALTGPRVAIGRRTCNTRENDRTAGERLANRLREGE